MKAQGAAAAAMPPSHAVAYRADIDGLRAVAVLAVLFCHAGVRGFRGGYIGVDLFFVISGFLITSVLLRDPGTNTASIATFYRRRILRIFPALFAMVLLVLPVALFVLLPSELMRFARSMGALALFSSNMLFYVESGYFEPASAFRVLLHTWSLGVEEQFYIFWPLLIFYVGRFGPARLKLAMLLITIVSFLASIAAVAHDASAAFYLLPFRAWELSIGGMLALSHWRTERRWLRELLAVAAVAVIALCTFGYDPFTPFPGLAAAAPVGAAVALIAVGSAGTVVSRMLSWRPIVFIGLISYSLYLWHWPLIVFTRMLLVDSGTLRMQAGLIVVSIAAGYFSWRFIETPVRRAGVRWRTPPVLWAGALVIAVALGVSGVLLGSGGLPARFGPQQRALGRFLDADGEQLYRRGTCFQENASKPLAPSCIERRTNRPAVLLVGDSHAAHLWPGLHARERRFEVLQATRAGCRPLLYARVDNGCRRISMQFLRSEAETIRPEVLLMSGNWQVNDEADIARTMTDPAIKRMNPVLIGPSPLFTSALPRLLVFFGDAEGHLPKKVVLDGPFLRDRELAVMARRLGFRYISLIDILCPPPGRRCRTLVRRGVPLYFDTGHLTAEGSALIADAILPELERSLTVANRAGDQIVTNSR